MEQGTPVLPIDILLPTAQPPHDPSHCGFDPPIDKLYFSGSQQTIPPTILAMHISGRIKLCLQPMQHNIEVIEPADRNDSKRLFQCIQGDVWQYPVNLFQAMVAIA
jgi:hypothetical protein